MNKLQRFLFACSFHELQLIREYMLKRYGVPCRSLRDLELAIINYIGEYNFEELYEVLA